MASVDVGDADYVQIRIEAHREDIGDRVFWAKVDRADYPQVSEHTWHITSDGNSINPQASIRVDGRRVGMSLGRFIIGYGELGNLGRVDYRNGNPLDCRRANLRIVTQDVILAKRKPVGGASRFKGVTWDPGQHKWLATFRGTKLGRFHDERDAARAFDDAALSHWGEDAYLNFPPTRTVPTVTPANARLLAFALRNCLAAEAVRNDDTAYATLHAALALAEGWGLSSAGRASSP